LAAAEAAYGEPDLAARLLDDSARAAAAQGAHLLIPRIEASRARLAS
jgi:hypothetical protein